MPVQTIRPPVVAGIGTEVDDPVGVGHHSLVVSDEDDRLTRADEPIEEIEQMADIGKKEAAGWLVENVDAALFGHLDRQLEPLPLAADSAVSGCPRISSPTRRQQDGRGWRA